MEFFFSVRVYGSRFSVQGLGSGLYGSGFKVWDLRIRASRGGRARGGARLTGVFDSVQGLKVKA